MSQAFTDLSIDFDVLVIDIAAGVTESVINFSRSAHEVILVVCDEPASITDAYALIKVLSRDRGSFRFHVVSNMVQDAKEGRILYQKLARVCQRFLGITLYFLGTVPYDPMLRKAVQRQSAVIEVFPGSPSARAFKTLAMTAKKWPLPSGKRGQLGHFVERLSEGTKDYGEYLV
jgi:flagellar biosynthesis protein FlhG